MLFNNIDPRKLFLIDAFGAFVSAVLLGVVLVRFEPVFGIPKDTLYFLAFIPCVFIVFDLVSYFLGQSKWRILLKTIAIANICYCLLSFLLAIIHRDSLSILGWIYILNEIVIILYIARIEYKRSHEKSQFK